MTKIFSGNYCSKKNCNTFYLQSRTAKTVCLLKNRFANKNICFPLCSVTQIFCFFTQTKTNLSQLKVLERLRQAWK